MPLSFVIKVGGVRIGSVGQCLEVLVYSLGMGLGDWGGGSWLMCSARCHNCYLRKDIIISKGNDCVGVSCHRYGWVLKVNGDLQGNREGFPSAKD